MVEEAHEHMNLMQIAIKLRCGASVTQKAEVAKGFEGHNNIPKKMKLGRLDYKNSAEKKQKILKS